ncbi:phage scaffolding protein [Enterococcus casseliflavus]|uniref:phage scaffolding protein n=1 Tax=Enterococcus casseliflavus TaxID=37734 RepID=UPI003EE07F34
MEWIKSILEKHRKEDGTVDLEAANKEIDQEFPKNAVPKDQYNNLSDSLKTAKDTIKSLEDKTKDNPDIQKELDTYKTKAQTLEAENNQLKIDSQVESVLRSAGTKDLDYAKFKLGSLELDKDGKVKDLDSRVKDLQKSMPDYFQDKSDDKDKDASKDKLGGFQRIDAKPGEGHQSKNEPTSIREAMAQTMEEQQN